MSGLVAIPSDKPRKIAAGHLVLYPDSTVCRVFWGGIRVPLRPFEFRLTVLLEPGSCKAFPHSYLEEQMRRHGFISPIRATVRKLRATFRTVDPTFDEVVSEWGYGYTWETR